MVKVVAAHDLALLKAEGRFAALPVVASRAMRLGSTVATVGFPNVGLQGGVPRAARHGGSQREPPHLCVQDDARYFQISVPVRVAQATGLCRSATRRTEWRGRFIAGSSRHQSAPSHFVRQVAERDGRVARSTHARERELRGEEQLGLHGIGAGSVGEAQGGTDRRKKIRGRG